MAAHLDAAIYGHYGQLLAEKFETELASRGIGDCIIAFRRAGGNGRNNISFANEAFEFIRAHRPCVAIGLDIEKFFDRLDHNLIKLRWQTTLGTNRLPEDHFNVFKSLAAFRWVDRTLALRAVGISPHNPKPRGSHRNRVCDPQAFREKIRGGGLVWTNPEQANRRGIPQGAPISALLSNIYMLEFDAVMHNAVSAAGGFYRRYCDDIMVVVPPADAASIETLAMAEIAKHKLSINPQKTTRATFPAQPELPAEKGKKPTGLKTRQLFLRYSYLIRRRFHQKPHGHDRQNENFITYAYRAARAMNAREIKRQVRHHVTKLKAEIKK
ncbi:MAG: hypothetical protein HS122_13120 [Opitutaceae bacterium]|nr:hypothetical protein [Opitutaceae bacterium]